MKRKNPYASTLAIIKSASEMARFREKILHDNPGLLPIDGVVLESDNPTPTEEQEESEALETLLNATRAAEDAVAKGRLLELPYLQPTLKAEREPARPRIPKGIKRLNDWRARWKKVKPEWERGSKNYTDLAAWLGKLSLPVSPETLADIIKAGEYGSLD